jgi:hypothetical protein
MVVSDDHPGGFDARNSADENAGTAEWVLEMHRRGL